MTRIQAPSTSECKDNIIAMDVEMPETATQTKKQKGKQSSIVETPTKRAKTAKESEFASQLADDHATAQTTKQRWERPDAPVVNPKEDAIVLQWIDIDVYTGQPLARNPHAGRAVPGNTEGSVPIIRFYGVLPQGSSVLVHVHGFTPYFFVEAPEGFTDDMCAEYRVALNARVRDAARGNHGRIPNHVVAVAPVMKQSLQGYHGKTLRKFLQIYTALPEFVPTTRTILQRGFKAHSSLPEQGFLTYESNVPYVLRYMVDNDIVGANWLELEAGTYSLRSRDTKTGLCQLECDIAFDSLVSHPTSIPKWLSLGPLRILSFDIECMGRRGSFPDPQEDPVIQIANFVTVQGESKARIRNIFVLDTCLPVVGAEVISFKNERDLLVAWSKFVLQCDPDILTGYNVQNFDIPYLMKRAAALKCGDEFALLGRIRNRKSVMKQTTFSSSAYGTRESTETRMPGRIMMDMIHYMWRNQKLSSYSLNAVSAEFLGQQKEDVHHSIISDLQRGTDEDRRRLAVYCLKDAYLPQQLMDKLLVVVNYVEMARVTGVPVDFLFTRGQQIKVLSMLYRKARAENLLIPNNPRTEGGGNDVGYEGATVIEPKKGYYDTPIATLDFASLYPSIMMAHNLCYTTLIFPSDISKGVVKEGEYEKSPSGDYFVRASKQKGLLPTILEELLAARKRAKADMKKATDPLEKQVMNGRQLALKISANSVYGFTGATVGQLPCLPISRSVTAYGRQMIDDTKKAVEEKYTIANGYSANADVIYGDTDSVMIKFGVDDVASAMKLGFEAAEEVTKIFPRPVALEFEKVYFPYLLMSKKRYAGLFWTKPEKWDKMDCKGIESVRRDNCQLARTVVDTCLRKILIERNVPGAIQYTKDTISALLQNKIDISLLIISKSLSAKSEDYKGKAAHVELAKRMELRDPNTAPKVGDRVPYVMIQTAKNVPGYEKSEDPLYVLENNIPIDTQFYLDRQLAKPLGRLFDPIIKNSDSLLRGDHTKSVFKATPSKKVGLMRFAVKSLRCLGCKVMMAPGDKSAVCENCRAKKGEFYLQRLAEANALERKFAALWTECQRCQGSLHQDVLCSNKDCPIFYMRKKVQQDLKSSDEVMARFDF